MVDSAVQTRSAFVALLGAPNAGKSTLINRLVGQKISIVTPKVQTTRFRVRGVKVVKQSQLVFIDTPGIFEASKPLEKAMVQAAWGGAADSDILVLLVDASARLNAEVRGLLEKAASQHKPRILVLNKVDAVKKHLLLPLTAEIQALVSFERLFMVSAKTGDGIDELKTYLAEQAKPGPWFYPEDQLTDVNERLLAAEVTREQLFLKLREELPYSLHVDTEQWEEKPDGSIVLHQVIYVERENQKKIVLGSKGATIKAIGEGTRRELKNVLGKNVHLFLFVKVQEGWKRNPEHYRTLGLDYKS